MNGEVLIVDDDQVVIFLHELLLKRSGITDSPKVFKHGETALEYLRLSNGVNTPRLILLDISMPVMDGWDFLNEIRKNPPASPLYIFMVTSSIDPVDREKAAKYSEVIDFIEKPLNIDKLLYLRNHDKLKALF